MVTGGLNVQWLTIITTAIWPVLALLYYRLAKIEERESEAKYGEEFLQYKSTTPRFLLQLRRKHVVKGEQIPTQAMRPNIL
jgi:protein-S-isoprenylcysteine O-methyltransferase Ste14